MKATLLRLLTAFLPVCLGAVCGSAQEQGLVVLKGTIVTPTEVVRRGKIAIRGNRIAQIGANLRRLPKAVETDSYIFSGLINLHDHITWNFLPRWQPGRSFNDRYEWQQTSAYNGALDGPHNILSRDPALACDADRFGEIKAILGGATAVVGSLGPGRRAEPRRQADDNNCIVGLARNLDRYAGFDDSVLNREKLRYEVFPLRMDPSDAIEVQEQLNAGKLKAFLAHVGEGRSSDAESAGEFERFAKLGNGFLSPGVSIIHGVAFSRADFEQMAAHGVGLIWSPRSNLELYGATADVRSAKEAGVKIAIAPDWSPSGSDGMLEELQYAAAWNAAQTAPVFNDAEFTAMATTIPAQLAGLSQQIGQLKKDFYADLLLLRKTEADPYRTLTHAGPLAVRLVMIGGTPVYGDIDLMKRLLPHKHLETISICGQAKALYVEPQPGIPESEKTFKQISEELKSKLSALHIPLAQLAPCQTTNGQ